MFCTAMEEILNLLPFGATPAIETFMADFEPAAINAFQAKFPDAQISGCYFHLGQKIGNII